jgi:hypothetical protein
MLLSAITALIWATSSSAGNSRCGCRLPLNDMPAWSHTTMAHPRKALNYRSRSELIAAHEKKKLLNVSGQFGGDSTSESPLIYSARYEIPAR